MDLIIVDCQNDFIDGTMVCKNANVAVDNIIEILKDDMNVYYTSDFHPNNHMSFEEFGGIWPPHCVEGTWGAEIHDKFHESNHAPNNENTFFKGRNPKEEEYSGHKARNGNDQMLKEVVGDKIYIAGIASEYCVRETALAFLKDGKEVIVLKDLLAYVDEDDHFKNLEDLEEKGVIIE
ncbi:MAG: isochorismatase family protein [Tissierellia bacterium]|nr:isochorismatase family protein [Tissierellia bacterium]